MSNGNDRERQIGVLLGRRVLDREGRAIGRIEEFHAEQEGDYYVVAAVDLGPVALLERLAVRHLGVTWPGRAHGYRVEWKQIDLQDEECPRLLCDRSELVTRGHARRARS